MLALRLLNSRLLHCAFVPAGHNAMDNSDVQDPSTVIGPGNACPVNGPRTHIGQYKLRQVIDFDMTKAMN